MRWANGRLILEKHSDNIRRNKALRLILQFLFFSDQTDLLVFQRTRRSEFLSATKKQPPRFKLYNERRHT